MKIVFLVFVFLPKWIAGSEIATYNLANYLAKRGHEVHVITSLDNGLQTESRINDFVVHRISYRKIRFFGIFSFWVKILLCLRKIKPDIVHAQGIDIAMPAFFGKVTSKIPYVIWGQGSDVYLSWPFKKQISRLVLQNAGAVIGLTENMRKEMEKIYEREVLVIPNGVNLNKVAYFEKKKESSKQRIIFVGTLKSIKGVRYLIESMVLIKKKNPNIELIIVGDGEDRVELEKLTLELNLKKDVIFVGKINNEDVGKYLVTADLFVLPSLSEGFGIVVIEAMASGLPIISTNVGGLPDIIEEGVNGFLVEPKNSNQIAERALELLNNDSLREKFSENNRNKSREYDWEKIVSSLESVYKKLIINI